MHQNSFLEIKRRSGSNSYACFSTDSWMVTPNGKRRMDQVNIGDMVLTVNMTSTFFTPIIMWLHREPDETHQFYTIMTEYGKMLAVTEKHLVYRNPCDGLVHNEFSMFAKFSENYDEYVKYLPKHRNAVFAKDLKIGDCFVLLYKGKYRQQRIKEISITNRRGIYAPVTSNGRIVINDIVVSTFTEVKHIKFQLKYFKFVSTIIELSKSLGDYIYKRISIPVGSSLASDVLQLLLP